MLARLGMPFGPLLTPIWDGTKNAIVAFILLKESVADGTQNLSSRQPLEIGAVFLVLMVGMLIGVIATTVCFMRSPRIAKVYLRRVKEVIAAENARKTRLRTAQRELETARKKKAT